MLTEFGTLGNAVPPEAQVPRDATINLEFAGSSVTQHAGPGRRLSDGLRAAAPGCRSVTAAHSQVPGRRFRRPKFAIATPDLPDISGPPGLEPFRADSETEPHASSKTSQPRTAKRREATCPYPAKRS